tara:strand:+ start:506 stop:1327 length:822 start_codon:yes stop_codon:yes gene_type:complete
MSFDGDLYPTAGADVVMTTKGDMVDYNTARQRLGIGSANQILQVKSGLPSWETLSTAGSVLTTQGDILYENASGLARLGFGTSGDVLTTKGTGADPVWSTPSSGQVSLLETVTLGSANANVAKASMTYSTADYAYWIIAFSGKAETNEASALEFRINNLSANYGYTVTENYNGTITGTAGSITTEIPLMSTTVHTGNTQAMNVIVTIQSSTVGYRYYNIVSDCWIASNTNDTNHVIGGQAGTPSTTFSKFDFFLSTGNNFETDSSAALYGVLR